MGKRTGPRHGSKAFYPRKKAKRIYPTVKSFRDLDKTGLLGFLVYKAGMTHIYAVDTYENSPSFGQKVATPVTVLECPPLFVFGLRIYEKKPEGLFALGDVYTDKLPKELSRVFILPKKYKKEEKIKELEKRLERAKEVRALVCTQPKIIKMKKKPEVVEVKINGKPEEAWKFGLEILGKEINPEDIFVEGDYVDVTGITKGKGTKGPVQRFGIKIQVRKAHGHRRMPGAIGAWHPARVLHTVPMSGQTGFQRRTDLNKRILKMGKEGKEVTPVGGFLNYGEVRSNYILVKGSVPGPKKRLLFLRHSIRDNRQKKKEPLPEIKHISQTSQQYR